MVISIFFIHPPLHSSIPKGYHAIITVIFSCQRHHQHHQHQSQMMTGPCLHHGKVLSLLKSYISRPIYLKALSINFSKPGALYSSPTAISPLLLIIKTFMHRSMQSNWERFHGNHTLLSISGSVLRMVQSQGGWRPNTKYGIVTPGLSSTISSQTLSLPPTSTMLHTATFKMRNDSIRTL